MEKKSNDQISSNFLSPNDLKFEVIEIMWQPEIPTFLTPTSQTPILISDLSRG